MSWILIAILAYFFLALVNVGDKLFLGNFIPNYKVYTIIVGLLGLLIFVIAPWFLAWPGWPVFLISLVSGILFILALLAFFHALQIGEASRVIPLIGGLVPFFSLLFSVVFLGNSLQGHEWLSFGLLIIGTVLIVRLPHKTHWHEQLPIIKNFSGRHHLEIVEEVFLALTAAMAFGASFVASKYVYEQADFLNGFIWIRLGSFFIVLLLLLNKQNWQALKNAYKKIKSRKGFLFLGNQGIGAVGFTLQGWSISLGSVALVNALQGIQYVIVIFLAALASFKFPKLAQEGKFDKKIMAEKIFAVIIIGAGLWVLAAG